MGRSATVALWVVGGTLVAAAAARRVRAERGDALRREPFVGLAELARRIQARRGGFGSAVTGIDLRRRGIDLRQPFDDSFFGGGGFGGGPLAGDLVAGELVVGGGGDSGAVAFLSPGGPSDTTTDTATFGLPANTAPQDFTAAQFASVAVGKGLPSMQGIIAAFTANPLGLLAASINAVVNAVRGPQAAPVAPGVARGIVATTTAGKAGLAAAVAGLAAAGGNVVGAVVAGLGAVAAGASAASTASGRGPAPSTGQAAAAVAGAVLGLLGKGIPSASVAAPGLGGLPVGPGPVIGLGLFLGDLGVKAALRGRTAADPTFQAQVDAEVAAQQADPGRFFAVLMGTPVAPLGPEITFATPRPSDPIDAPAAPASGPPAGSSSSSSSPGGGEPGGAPGGPGPAGDAPAGPPGGVPGGPGEVGGLAAQGEGPGFAGGFTGGELGLSLSEAAPAPDAPAPTGEPSDAGGGGDGGGDGGVGAGGGGDSGPGGEGP